MKNDLWIGDCDISQTISPSTADIVLAEPSGAAYWNGLPAMALGFGLMRARRISDKFFFCS